MRTRPTDETSESIVELTTALTINAVQATGFVTALTGPLTPEKTRIPMAADEQAVVCHD